MAHELKTPLAILRADIENSQLQKNLHALRMKTDVKSVAARLGKISPGRIRQDLNSDFSVFVNPTHLDQLITNLLTNALKFSAPLKSVELILTEQTLVIKDDSPGLPDEVRERLGQPFNICSSDEGI